MSPRQLVVQVTWFCMYNCMLMIWHCRKKVVAIFRDKLEKRKRSNNDSDKKDLGRDEEGKQLSDTEVVDVGN